MTPKPRIFINMHYMELGGAERALLGLLNVLDTARFEIDLFLNDQRGELMPFIPSTVNLLPSIPAYSMLERPIIELIQRGYWRIALARLWAKWITFKSKHKNTQHIDDATCFFNMSRYTTPLLPDIQPKTVYDLAISFLTPHLIVLDKVRAKKKVAWIHTDYTNIYIDSAKEFPMWARYDKIAAVSEEAANKFVQVFPSLASKVFVCENMLPVAFIRERAKEFVPSEMTTDNNNFNILSIGRYSNPKRFDELPLICKQLISLVPQHTIRWFIIGYGTDEELIRQRIHEAGVQDHVILLGKRANPYPYIQACDLYIQPSRYEGKSITVREAQILCKTIVITDYPTAKSQIKDHIDGVIVPMDIDSCAKGIAQVISDRKLRQQLCAYLLENDYGNASEVEKIYCLL